MRNLNSLLPLRFRVLYRQFLLRVIDLEALSVEADVPRFIGQFAGVLIMISLVAAFGAFMSIWDPTITPEAYQKIAWSAEQHLISGMMFVVGLLTVASWDATFPDKRDAMVLSPLPVRPRTILLAKVSASAAMIGIAILSLNFASGIAWPLVIGGTAGFIRTVTAYWFTLIVASIFLYSVVLAVQGLGSLLLPRGLFLRFSAILQLLAFGLFLGVYFLQPTLVTASAVAENHTLVSWLPTYWFFALFNQLCGSLPASLGWLASQAWIGSGLAIWGAGASLLFCYLRTMRKTIEEPDLVPAARGFHWRLRLGTALQTAILLFTARSLIRSKQHRVIFAFYLAWVFGFALSSAKATLWTHSHLPLSPDFVIATFLMMAMAIGGLRSVFSLPVSLNANWVLRTTQLRSTQKYIAATRRSLLLIAALPAWLLAAALSLSYRPVKEVAEHLAILALVGIILTDFSLIGFHKVPFTCSYLPGKVNVQFVFWGALVVFATVAVTGVEYEMRSLGNPYRCGLIMIVLGAIALGAWAWNRRRAKSAALYFEELPPEIVITLGLTSPSALK